jgi:ribosomal protein S17
MSVTRIAPKNEPLVDDRLYSPIEIVENGWILSKSGKKNHSAYNLVLLELKKGNLIGIDISRPNSRTIYWRVLGKEIRRYMEENAKNKGSIGDE